MIVVLVIVGLVAAADVMLFVFCAGRPEAHDEHVAVGRASRHH